MILDSTASRLIDQDEACEFRKDSVGADDTGFVDVRKDNEHALKKAVATVGPVSIAIDASNESFQFYHSGECHDIS